MNVNVRNLSGLAGGKCVTGSATVTGDINAIQFLTNGTISAYDGNVVGLVGHTFQAGTIIYGQYKSVTIGTGTAILYSNG